MKTLQSDLRVQGETWDEDEERDMRGMEEYYNGDSMRWLRGTITIDVGNGERIVRLAPLEHQRGAPLARRLRNLLPRQRREDS